VLVGTWWDGPLLKEAKGFLVHSYTVTTVTKTDTNTFSRFLVLVLVRYAATQVATQLHQRRIQVVRSNKVALTTSIFFLSFYLTHRFFFLSFYHRDMFLI